MRMTMSTDSALEHLYANLSRSDVLQHNHAHVFKCIQICLCPGIVLPAGYSPLFKRSMLCLGQHQTTVTEAE
jgi:hypothetical protein